MSTIQENLKKYLDHLYANDDHEAYDTIELAMRELTEQKTLATKTAESLLTLWVHGMDDPEHAEAEARVLTNAMDNLRRLDEWGRLPWESTSNVGEDQ